MFTHTKHFLTRFLVVKSQQNKIESVHTCTMSPGVVTLISMVIKSVPIPVLQAQFDPVSKLLMECLARNTSQESQSEANVGMTKALLGCLRCDHEFVFMITFSMQQCTKH